MFALLAVGLVLTYKTSGVFNLAFAAQAYASAAVFYVIAQGQHKWPLVPRGDRSSVVVVGPLIGVILDRALYRHQRTRRLAGQARHVARPARRRAARS